MRASRKNGYTLLFIVILCCWSFSVMGAVPDYIKVGLESIYQNAQSITLTSDDHLSVGYYDAYGFGQIGTLNSRVVSISKANEVYYDTGSIYYSFQAAAEAANMNGGIPVYIEQGLFGVYTLTNTGSMSSVTLSDTCYVAKDTLGTPLLIFNKGANELVFRGYDSATGLNLIGVGNSKKYRGAIGIGGTSGITPYNILSIEEYLYGVVPCEMSPTWPEEALKAQAVAARSIAIYQYNRYISSGYNVVDTTTTQMYGGYNKEDPRTTAAVDATRKQTVQYNGAVAEAVYFSTSGGYTEAAANVWGTDIGYLVGVIDNFETEPAQGEWTRTITLDDLNACLMAQGINIGKAQGVQIVSRTKSGRVQEMSILGSNGNYSMSMEKIRTFFGGSSEGSLKSRLFSFNGVITPGTGNMGGVTNGQTTYKVLSANGLADLNLDGVHTYATNGSVTQVVGASAAMQSATDSVNGINSAGNGTMSSVSLAQTETIWGDFTIYGKGYGHGVGMSQSGAKGMAKAGFNYIDILKYYYTGVSVG